MTRTYNRRKFIEFIGKGTIGAAVAPTLFISCSSDEETKDSPEATKDKKGFPFEAIMPQEVDDLVLAEGLAYSVLIKWGDTISGDDYFGFNNDFIQFLPLKDTQDEALLWVNHEYVDTRFVTGYKEGDERTKATVDKEMYNVGGSFIKIKKEDNNWMFVENDAQNKRVTGHTKIPFNWDAPVGGREFGNGTLGNCSGGLTPWGNILTCEENYDGFYGETDYSTGEPVHIQKGLAWDQFYPENKPEHYGWVVEVNPETGEAQKHIALGRCAHECAKLHQLEDGRLVVYTGDDDNDRCLYKFIGSEPNSLKTGTLYVANLEDGIWESLDYESQEILQENFKDQTEVLVRAREAALLVGGSKLDRPEDIEIDPVTGSVLIALTNNTPMGNYYGSILKIDESKGYDGLSFTHDTHLAGGEDTGFACPDNMAFDPKGNLWFTSDMSGSVMGEEPYTRFKNNGLFFVPRSGPKAGEVLQVASAPTHAEFTGPCFSPDGLTLFLSVQHPGEYSEDPENPSSNWPDGDNAMPKPSVVCITGEPLNEIMKGNLG